MAFKSVLLIVIFIVSLVEVQCWVFNDISTKSLRDDALQLDLEDLTPEELARLRFSLIYPGTKWCGPGNIAEEFDDLGSSKEADACCRDHDNCPDNIAAGDTKHNLTNSSYFTRLSCDCDESFRRCLQDAGTKAAITIGYMYFNVVETKCYRKDYLITGCKKGGGWLNTKCVEYSYDMSSEKTYQWFDVPNFQSARLRRVVRSTRSTRI